MDFINVVSPYPFNQQRLSHTLSSTPIPYQLPLYPINYPYHLPLYHIIYPYTLSSTPIIYPHTLSSTPTYALIYAFIYPPLHPLFLGTRKWVTNLLFAIDLPPSPTSHLTTSSHLHHTLPPLYTLSYTLPFSFFSPKRTKRFNKINLNSYYLFY